jgi:hypothetical protein
MSVYLKTIYIRISQMVCKYTKAISIKKNCFSDRWANNEAFGSLTTYVGILSVKLLRLRFCYNDLDIHSATSYLLSLLGYVMATCKTGRTHVNLQKTGMTRTFVGTVYVPLRPVNLDYRKKDWI